MERVMSFNPMLRIVIVAVATGTLQKARIAAPAKQLAKFSRLARLAVLPKSKRKSVNKERRRKSSEEPGNESSTTDVLLR